MHKSYTSFFRGHIIKQKISFEVVLLLIFLLPCSSSAQTHLEQPAVEQKPTVSFPGSDGSFSKAKLTYKIISAKNKSWGYDIYVEGKLLIHQSSVPALPGNEGFKSKQAAGKVATKIIEKIRKGENPPSVTIEEMKALKAL